MVYKSYIFISKVGYRSYMLSSTSWNICPVTILPPQRAVSWSLISIDYFNKLQKFSEHADFEIQAAWKRKPPWKRQQWTPHTTNTQPGTPPQNPTKLIRALVSVPKHPSVHTNQFKAFLQYKPSVQSLCHFAQYIKSLWTTENHCLKQTAQVGN